VYIARDQGRLVPAALRAPCSAGGVFPVREQRASKDVASVIEGLQREVASLRREAGAPLRQGVESHLSFLRRPAHLDQRLDAGLPRHGDPDPMKTQVTSADPITLPDGHNPHFGDLKERMTS